MTTIAKVRYRDYVGPWTIAVKFLDIDFSGDNKYEYERLWTKIDLKISEEKRQEEQDLINSKKELELKHKNINQTILKKKNELSKYHPWYKRILGKHFQHEQVPILKEKLNALTNQSYNLDNEIEEYTNEIESFKNSDSVYKLSRKKDDFLIGNGFKLVSTIHKDSNDITVETWQRD